MKVLLTIGEFSRMTHLSVKALRHYQDVGLLEPAHLERMEDRLEQTRATVESLRALLQESLSHSNVEYRSVASMPSLAIRERVGFADCGTWLTAAYAELYDTATTRHLDIAGRSDSKFTPRISQ